MRTTTASRSIRSSGAAIPSARSFGTGLSKRAGARSRGRVRVLPGTPSGGSTDAPRGTTRRPSSGSSPRSTRFGRREFALPSTFDSSSRARRRRDPPTCGEILSKYAAEFRTDGWILCDGPVHQSRRPQLFFGARGVTGLELTVYGPNRGLHSGHYGNWAPNPIVRLTHLLDAMRGEDGRILIPGFESDVRPLSERREERDCGRSVSREGSRKGVRVFRTGIPRLARRGHSSTRPERPRDFGRTGRSSGRERHPAGSDGLDRLSPRAGRDAGKRPGESRGVRREPRIFRRSRGSRRRHPGGAREDREARLGSRISSGANVDGPALFRKP